MYRRQVPSILVLQDRAASCRAAREKDLAAYRSLQVYSTDRDKELAETLQTFLPGGVQMQSTVVPAKFSTFACINLPWTSLARTVMEHQDFGFAKSSSYEPLQHSFAPVGCWSK